jgi:hypothetical protein
MAAKHTETGSKMPRGKAQASIDLIEKMHRIASEAQPITGRGVGYKLFTAGLIASMARSDMQRVYRLLREARESGTIPWEWIVDETRELERAASWDNPKAYARAVIRSYRRDYWNQQPVRVEVWSEKGTVRGVLQPVLDEFGVGFRVMHGFSGASTVHEIADSENDRTLVALYVGDYDPSGMYMSECDLPKRLEKYGGFHVDLRRVALLRADGTGLPSFPAADKRTDTRYSWFVDNFGHRCWELDAFDPNDLRERVEREIEAQIEWDAWRRCKVVEAAEQQSLEQVISLWPANL